MNQKRDAIETIEIEKLRKQCHAILGAIAKRSDAEARLTLLLDILRTAQGNPTKPLEGIHAEFSTYFEYKANRHRLPNHP